MPDLLEVICITQNGDFVRCEDGISLHSKIVDLTYDADWQTADGGGDSKPEKKKEPEASKGHEDDSKKEHKESVVNDTEDGGTKDSDPKKKLV